MHQYKPSGRCPQLVMNKRTIFFFCFITMKLNNTENHMDLVGQFYKPWNRRNSTLNMVTHPDLGVQVDDNS